MQAIKEHADKLLRRASPAYQLKRKHEAELAYWQSELAHLEDWFQKGTRDWWGLRPPSRGQKLAISDLWVVNAVATRNALRPTYWERLQIEKDHFRGQRVLEVGSGPMAPILQFSDCTRHCVDPLVNLYMEAGWHLFAYEAKFVNTGGESLPYPDGYFDAVISVNALDHVDDFERVAAEIERVLRPGGRTYFEVEYHAPTVTEPVRLNDGRVARAFSRCELKLVMKRSGQELFEALVRRFKLDSFDFPRFGPAQFCAWQGVRKSA